MRDAGDARPAQARGGGVHVDAGAEAAIGHTELTLIAGVIWGALVLFLVATDANGNGWYVHVEDIPYPSVREIEEKE